MATAIAESLIGVLGFWGFFGDKLILVSEELELNQLCGRIAVIAFKRK